MIKFGTGGFRAVIGEDFNKLNTQKIAQALANIIKKEKSDKPVIIGYDRRFMSDQFAKWFAEVLCANKINVLLYTKPVPTPTVMFTVMNLKYDYGITITASHNPYFYSGIKICVKGGKDADVTFTNAIEKACNTNLRIKSVDFDIAKKDKLVKDFDNIKDYIKFVTSYVSNSIKENNLKVLFNSMHGVTPECIHLLAKKYNLAKYNILNENHDPFFEYSLPSPNEETLEEFKKEVIKGKYSVGLACDADGDRLGVVDETGEYHNCNTIMAIIYYYLVKYRNMQGDIVKNLSTSIILDKLAAKFGFKCHEVPVGFKWVSAKMNETNALIGGESSGGLTVRKFTPCKDSMFAISLLLDAMANIKKPLSKIVQEVRKYADYISSYVENNVFVRNKTKLIKALKKNSPKFSYKPVKIITCDGYKYVFEDNSWVLIRFSGTEDLLRYYVEFSTEIECERNIKAIENFIKNFDI